MKITTTPSKEILNMIADEQTKRIRLLADFENNEVLIPMHTADMRVKVPNDYESVIKKVILPPLLVEGRKSDKGLISTSNLRYYVSYNVKPLPICHIFSDSGFICLGGLSMAPFIEPQQILEPLELLLVNNDRIMHGNPHIDRPENLLNDLNEYFKTINLKVDIDLSLNWVENDTLWYISSLVYEKFDNESKRLKIMDDIYKLVFTERNDDS